MAASFDVSGVAAEESLSLLNRRIICWCSCWSVVLVLDLDLARATATVEQVVAGLDRPLA
eukprot:scaffold6136_cov197-Alexandrium_tamarense.AAC.3